MQMNCFCSDNRQEEHECPAFHSAFLFLKIPFKCDTELYKAQNEAFVINVIQETEKVMIMLPFPVAHISQLR